MAVILFDLDNTLLDEESARRKHLPEFFEMYRHLSSFNFATFSRRWLDSLEVYYRMFLEGTLTIEEQRIRRIEHSLGFSGLPKNELEDIGRNYTILNEKSWMVFPGWEEFLKRNTSRKSLVTNGSSEQQRKKLSILNLEKYFDYIFISEEVGLSKPNSKLFELIVEKIGVEPSQCIFVGDSLENDILPSLEIGMKSVWINHNGRKSSVSHGNLTEVRNVELAIKELENIGNLTS